MSAEDVEVKLEMRGEGGTGRGASESGASGAISRQYRRRERSLHSQTPENRIEEDEEGEGRKSRYFRLQVDVVLPRATLIRERDRGGQAKARGAVHHRLVAGAPVVVTPRSSSSSSRVRVAPLAVVVAPRSTSRVTVTVSASSSAAAHRDGVATTVSTVTVVVASSSSSASVAPRLVPTTVVTPVVVASSSASATTGRVPAGLVGTVAGETAFVCLGASGKKNGIDGKWMVKLGEEESETDSA